MTPGQPGEQLILEIEGLNHRGEGIGRHRGQVVFVPLAAPGDRIRATVTEVKKKYLRAGLAELLESGTGRAVPRCPAFGRCGGCHIQHLDYAHQLQYKTGLVRNAFARIGGLDGTAVLSMLGMDDPWHYRNKVRLHIGCREGKVVLGFFAPSSHVLGRLTGESFACRLLDEDLNRLVRVVEHWLNQNRNRLLADKGGISEITLRKAAGTGETMVVLTTAKDFRFRTEKMIGELAASGRITTVVQQMAESAGREEDAEQTEILYGPGYLTDRLDDLVFRLSATSFYQVNPAQTRVLYRLVRAYAGLTGREQVVDAFCGVGTIALYLARRAGHVLGLELSPAAVADAQRNARLNKITNATFEQGAVEKSLPRLLKGSHRPDLVVLDPPRRGCHRGMLDVLAGRAVPRVIYVSCDPATLARDLGYLAGHGYRLVEARPVDMFPQTSHVECAVLMSRVEK
ncbi:23S rRNA (uracil(1939)-C(5))-methyltransferase RlmD [Desulfotomaculum copahuensis]|uniref:23S rRNA (Uracil-5-)-methyltransferase RumA n=1 Tax=Desulfotomaculum copahuensis TaxID=1838280 RepID=A0A1B7LIF6_9FIRM|nr:23S rRNA (uracil(1939)-C(5))-methyltransferase RlmD [Desulfotomaculum copahuensis]OAT86359.1 23S rRNA (uracil-5-)-methyltransferase RumA [Desulfotomaculum copahuensis]